MKPAIVYATEAKSLLGQKSGGRVLLFSLLCFVPLALILLWWTVDSFGDEDWLVSVLLLGSLAVAAFQALQMFWSYRQIIVYADRIVAQRWFSPPLEWPVARLGRVLCQGDEIYTLTLLRDDGRDRISLSGLYEEDVCGIAAALPPRLLSGELAKVLAAHAGTGSRRASASPSRRQALFVSAPWDVRWCAVGFGAASLLALALLGGLGGFLWFVAREIGPDWAKAQGDAITRQSLMLSFSLLVLTLLLCAFMALWGWRRVFVWFNLKNLSVYADRLVVHRRLGADRVLPFAAIRNVNYRIGSYWTLLSVAMRGVSAPLFTFLTQPDGIAAYAAIRQNLDFVAGRVASDDAAARQGEHEA